MLQEMEKAYKPCVTILSEDFDEFNHFENSLLRLDMSSSPGYPYQKEATTNGEWLKWDGVTCDRIQVLRLWHDVKLVLEDKWEHVIRVFIKQEPHKKAKVLAGRWRLIMASSLPVQMCWHMLFGKFNDIEIAKAYYIPSQQGLQMVGGGWKQFYRSWKQDGTVCGIDKSSWDWTAPFWAIDLELEFRRRMLRGSRTQDWFTLANLLYRRMFVDPVLMTSDGRLYKQIVPGVMKSGCVNTISLNSHCQLFLHMAVCLEAGWDIHPLPRCCGDDTLSHVKHTLDMSLYERFGVVIKEVSETTEFVGHEFTENGPRPLYIMKHFKKLRYVNSEIMADYLDAMARMYVHTHYYEFWEYLSIQLGKPLPHSRDFYRYWYDISE